MKKTFALLFIAAMISAAACAYTADGAGLKGPDSGPVRLSGVNLPYLATLDQGEIERIFSILKNSGARSAGVYASYTGDKPYSFYQAPGLFNEKQFEKLDFIISEAEKNSVSLIIALSDSNDTYGGKEVYSSWVSGSNSDVFFKDILCKEYFKKYAAKLLARKNTVTGRFYKDEPAIFAWNLCADAGDKNDDSGQVLYDWAAEMSAYVKSIDPLHPVTIDIRLSAAVPGAVNSSDLFLLPGLDFVMYSVQPGTPDAAGQAAERIAAQTLSFFTEVNKPVIIIYGPAGARQGEDALAAGKAFFESNGSLFLADYGAPVSGEKGQALKTAADVSALADSFKSRLSQIKVQGIKAAAGVYSAAISFNLPEKAQAEVIYGEKMPLKSSTKMVDGEQGEQVVKIEGLKAKTRYFYAVRASNSSKSGISKAMSFTTGAPSRLRLTPFTRSNNFIKVKGIDFYDGDRAYKYVGTNNYYIRSLAVEKMDYIFREAQRVGFKVVRVGSNGEAFSEAEGKNPDPTRYFRIGPDKFNEAAYKSMDRVLDSARRNGMRVIIHFTDNWEYYGGVPVYAKWAGVSKNGFWTNDKCKEYFKQTMDAYLERKNTVNGLLYKNDPTIFAYDLMNEFRDENDPTSKEMTAWVEEMSAYFKTKDMNHMLTTGEEGFFLKADGTQYAGADFINTQMAAGIDFATYHIYPAGQYNHYTLKTTLWMMEKYITDGHNILKKPVVMEEYGIPGGVDEYPKAAWIGAMTSEFFKMGGNGVNYWFFIDPSYSSGDGLQVTPEDTEYVNEFIKVANEINAKGY